MIVFGVFKNIQMSDNEGLYNWVEKSQQILFTTQEKAEEWIKDKIEELAENTLKQIELYPSIPKETIEDKANRILQNKERFLETHVEGEDEVILHILFVDKVKVHE